MRIYRLGAEIVVLEEINEITCELLRKIPASADPAGSEAARERLYPAPTGGADLEADDEWNELVEPGLRQLFLDAVGLVREDLKQLDEDGSAGPALRLPRKNLEAWIHALIQARLVLAARYGFTERELEKEIPMPGDERAFALLQMYFYGLLEGFLLEQLD